MLPHFLPAATLKSPVTSVMIPVSYIVEVVIPQNEFSRIVTLSNGVKYTVTKVVWDNYVRSVPHETWE